MYREGSDEEADCATRKGKLRGSEDFSLYKARPVAARSERLLPLA